jgi:hypothetical protein
MEINSGKWYVYKKYAVDTYIPLFWDGYLLEFNTEEAARDFIAVADRELGFDFENVVVTTNVYFKTETPILNATFYRIRAGYGGIKDYLYDVRD